MIVYEDLSDAECKMLFRVDAHLDPGLGNEYFNGAGTTPFSVSGISPLFGNANGNQLVRINYRVGPWMPVSVIWPKGWPPPGLNRLGWLPKCEFGTGGKLSYYNEPPSGVINIRTFAYTDVHGNLAHGS